MTLAPATREQNLQRCGTSFMHRVMTRGGKILVGVALPGPTTEQGEKTNPDHRDDEYRLVCEFQYRGPRPGKGRIWTQLRALRMNNYRWASS